MSDWTIKLISERESIEAEADSVTVDGHGNLVLSNGDDVSNVVLMVNASKWLSVRLISTTQLKPTTKPVAKSKSGDAGNPLIRESEWPGHD